MNALLSKVVLPRVNTIIERGRVEKNVNLELVVNKYKNLNVSSIINNINKLFKDNLNNLLYYIQAKTTFALRSWSNQQGYIVREATKINKSPEVFGLGLSFIRKEESKLVVCGEKLDVFSYKDYFFKLRDIIFKVIKYKIMGGARLIVKGRLTPRYRADRAVYKLKWKGGLKNIESAFKGIPSVQYLGYQDSNVEKFFSASKRKIGSFGVRT